MNEKLVRDKIIEFSLAADDGRRFRKAERIEMPALLALKIREEAHEISEELQFATVDNVDRLIEELADEEEVREAIMDHYHITKQRVMMARSKKRLLKGAFAARIVLDLGTNLGSFERSRRESRD